ncbi:MAG: OmpH family outer membrane protein [Lentisphaerae bacterium]|nr:OmpH family outer membrane protein [Lentisphaerota bacterium]
MKKIFFISIFVTLLLNANAEQGKAESIAFISMKSVFENFHKTIKANADLDERTAAIESKYEEMLSKIKNLEQQIERIGTDAMDSSLSDDARQKIHDQAREKVEEYKAAKSEIELYIEKTRKPLRQEMHDREQKIIAEIQKVVNDYAKTNKITIVFDSSGKTLNNIESVVYYDPQLDITKAILNILNKGQN